MEFFRINGQNVEKVAELLDPLYAKIEDFCSKQLDKIKGLIPTIFDKEEDPEAIGYMQVLETQEKMNPSLTELFIKANPDFVQKTGVNPEQESGIKTKYKVIPFEKKTRNLTPAPESISKQDVPDGAIPYKGPDGTLIHVFPGNKKR